MTINFEALEGFNRVIVVLYFLNKITADKIINIPKIIMIEPKTSLYNSDFGKYIFCVINQKTKD